jgi:DNA-binding Xre family transcriptional regulator
MHALRIDRWKVKQEMNQVGIDTFADLADLVGVSPQIVSRWFRGGGFTAANLEALCRVLKCTPNDILTFDPNRLAPVANAQPAFSPR